MDPQPPVEPRLRRYLVLANVTLLSPDLQEVILERVGRPGPSHVHLVLPTTRDAAAAAAEDLTHHRPWPGGPAEVRSARNRLRTSLDRLGQLGVVATGEVIDADPVRAALVVVGASRFDEVIVSTLPAPVSRWLRMDAPSRLRRRLDVPVTHVEVRERVPV